MQWVQYDTVDEHVCIVNIVSIVSIIGIECGAVSIAVCRVLTVDEHAPIYPIEESRPIRPPYPVSCLSCGEAPPAYIRY